MIFLNVTFLHWLMGTFPKLGDCKKKWVLTGSLSPRGCRQAHVPVLILLMSVNVHVLVCIHDSCLSTIRFLAGDGCSSSEKSACELTMDYLQFASASRTTNRGEAKYHSHSKLTFSNKGFASCIFSNTHHPQKGDSIGSTQQRIFSQARRDAHLFGRRTEYDSHRCEFFSTPSNL